MYYSRWLILINPCHARAIYINNTYCIILDGLFQFTLVMLGPYIYVDLCHARTVYIYLNPCPARTKFNDRIYTLTFFLLGPYI